MAQVFTRQEELEHGVRSRAAILQRLIGTRIESDRVSASIFAVLRLNIALMMQRTIQGSPGKSRQTRDGDHDCSHCDLCTVGVSRADVDCSLKIFESIARVVKEKIPRAL